MLRSTTLRAHARGPIFPFPLLMNFWDRTCFSGSVFISLSLWVSKWTLLFGPHLRSPLFVDLVFYLCWAIRFVGLKWALPLSTHLGLHKRRRDPSPPPTNPSLPFRKDWSELSTSVTPRKGSGKESNRRRRCRRHRNTNVLPLPQPPP